MWRFPRLHCIFIRHHFLNETQAICKLVDNSGMRWLSLQSLARFKSDLIDRRRIALLQFFFALGFVGIGIRLLLVIVWSEEVLNPHLEARLVGLSMLVVASAALALGFWRFADRLVLIAGFVFVTFVAILAGNVAGDPVAVLLVIIVAAGLIGNSTRVLWTGIFSTFLVLGITVAFELEIFAGEDFISEPSFAAGASYCLQLLVATCLFYIVTRSMERSLEIKTESEDELQTTMSHAPIGILSCDQNGTVQRANAAFIEMLQLAEEAIVGRRIHELIGEGSAEKFDTSRQSPPWLTSYAAISALFSLRFIQFSNCSRM